MQELGRSEDEADGSVLEVGASEQNGAHLFATLRQPMETSMEKLPLMFDTPGRGGRPNFVGDEYNGFPHCSSSHFTRKYFMQAGVASVGK